MIDAEIDDWREVRKELNRDKTGEADEMNLEIVFEDVTMHV